MELKFSIKSSTHYLGFLRQMVSASIKSLPDISLGHQAEVACSLALVEAVNNVIFHAHENNEEKLIDILLSFEKNRVILEVTDEGPGFEMPDTLDPRIDGTHGRGLFIIRSVMNEVKYKTGKKNRLKMVYCNEV